VAHVPNGETLKESSRSHHTPVEEVGRVAEATGVRTLVLSLDGSVHPRMYGGWM
jgi:hypothetical protein